MNEVARSAAQRGMALLDLGRAGEAEKHLRKALAEEPGDATVLVLLAETLRVQGRYEAAADFSRSALAIDPQRVAAYAVLAAALAGRERYSEAIGTLRQGLALAPEEAELHLQEARILLAQERYEDALASVEHAAGLDPESSTAAALRAAALCQLRRYDDADTAVDEALRLDPENPDAHRLRGVIALHRGGGRSAVQAHRTALRLDPTDALSRDGLFFALKTRNPLYGWLLRFGLWLDTLPKGVRIAVLLAPLVLTRVLRPFDDQWWVRTLIVVVAVLVLLSWTLEPVMNCVLLLGRDRHLVGRDARRATYLFLAFLAAAVACAVFAQTAGPARLLPIAFGFGLWAMAVGSAHLLEPGQRKMVGIGAAVAAVLGGVGWAATATAAPGATIAVALLLLGGAAALWFTAVAD